MAHGRYQPHGQWRHLEFDATGRDRVYGWLSGGYHVSGVSRPGRVGHSDPERPPTGSIWRPILRTSGGVDFFPVGLGRWSESRVFSPTGCARRCFPHRTKRSGSALRAYPAPPETPFGMYIGGPCLFPPKSGNFGESRYPVVPRGEVDVACGSPAHLDSACAVLPSSTTKDAVLCQKAHMPADAPTRAS
jgi:hypothetical protein